MKKLSSILLATAGILFGHATLSAEAAEVRAYKLPVTTPMSAEAAAKAKPILPMLTSASQIPAGVSVQIRGASATLGSAGSSHAAKAVASSGTEDSGVAPSGFGTGNHPFSTKGAYSWFSSTPTNLYPWRPAGKLLFTRSGGSFVCSASMIKRGIAVTAAHCVVSFGSGVFNSSTSFQPARYDATAPYGTIVATNIWVPTAYANGTDTCTVAGVVCNNDVAVVRLATNIGNTTGWYGYGINGYGYTNSTFLTKTAAAITQLGYPVAFNLGLRMMRTDSFGYFATPNNVIIGSDQTGGSSGGPWLVNFGTTPSSTSSAPSENASNIVVATTSWGYISSLVKVQGASRFGNNAQFPVTSNIQALVNAACAAFPASC